MDDCDTWIAWYMDDRDTGMGGKVNKHPPAASLLSKQNASATNGLFPGPANVHIHPPACGPKAGLYLAFLEYDGPCGRSAAVRAGGVVIFENKQ